MIEIQLISKFHKKTMRYLGKSTTTIDNEINIQKEVIDIHNYGSYVGIFETNTGGMKNGEIYALCIKEKQPSMKEIRKCKEKRRLLK